MRFLTRKDISNIPAIKWGIDNEDKAREAYVTKMSSSHNEFTCSPAGLVITPQYPYLGASPDGFTQCECCGDGIIVPIFCSGWNTRGPGRKKRVIFE